ncbi:purine and other phosphorylase-like protein, family 1 [Dyella sp.]|uniref:phosphorylase family protein n=1 Tax=Dyella sp. TaxID=1869338 RepID=UPI002D79E174|nr:purine and other phosphorylase-like protein, family 1 [Dyella sp.]HET7330460.1 purine and other phosphorylase-like protein, family 1 [Dyella sp.]
MSTGASIRTTGVVVALASEARAFTSHAAKPDSITTLPDGAALYLSGMGPRAARGAAEALVAAGACALAVFGVAGALDDTLRNGTLFCPERVLDGQGRAYATDVAWCASLQQRLAGFATPLRTTGALLSVASPLLTAAAKRTAHRQFAALAVDMESAAVAAVAQERGLPFAVLRAIVDEADDAIPPALNGSVDTWGRPRPLRLLAAFGRQPSLASELPRLYSRMQRATHALRAAAQAAGPALGWPR